jgi:hypothetical protein
LQSIAGRIRAGEAARAGQAVAARQRGSTFLLYLIVAGLIVAGALLGYWMGVAVNAVAGRSVIDPWLTQLIGMILGWLAYAKTFRPYLTLRFKRKMSARGLSTEMDMSFEAGPSGFKSTVGAVSKAADWTSVTELFQKHGYWIFLVQMEGWYLPRRYFQTPEGEKAFLRECLEHMTEAARGRSPDAVSFVGG